ncbi:N-methyl-L-tryptophan oxidase [Sediminicola arcticus]|jgi:sarcosine oxidase|uniref:N-methyl-L-tryptophan oxidase n=1 Tax=Sediminicola arcticus TaxID=1574308 RepID=A0ABV2SR62_9FLAO
MSSQHYDVIVVGIGSMGAPTCYNLAKRGVKVLGLEQFTIVHENGSHAGQSRMVRKAYFENPDYVPLLDTAYALWEELEEITGQKLFHKTGLFYTGPNQNNLLEGVKLSAQKYNITINNLNESECLKKFPSFKLTKNYEYLFEPDAGYVVPEQIIKLYTKLAINEGATILENQLVEAWSDTENVVSVRTKTATYIADKIIFTAGGFTNNLFPKGKNQLVPRRQVTCWFQPKKPSLFTSEKFPCFLYTTPELPGAFYGFPLLSTGDMNSKMGIKVGYHYPGEVIDPYTLHNFDHEKESKLIKEFMHSYIPDGYESVLSTKSCIYTYTEDGDFILENHKDYQNVSIACGFSGHGFKLAPLVGEILADLSLEGKTKHPIGFLSSNRFL